MRASLNRSGQCLIVAFRCSHLQSKSLNQDSGVLFSPPSIVKSALGVSEMMLDADMDPLQSESAQVQPANQYYFSTLPNSNQHVHLSNHNNNHYHQPSFPSNMLSQSMHPQQQLRSFDHVGQQSQAMYHSTPVANSSYSQHNLHNNHGMGGGQGQGNHSRMHIRSQGMFDKENLPNDVPFLMLRGEDDELDLGGFQMSKSIFNQGQGNNTNQQQQQQQHHSQQSHSGNVRKDGRSFGTLMSTQHTNNNSNSNNPQNSSVGGYFGFDRTNVMACGSSNSNSRTNSQSRSPMKVQRGYVGHGQVAQKVEPLDMYADSNSQASLRTTVSSPASTISYFDGGQVGNGNRPIMEFLDVNDEYWLEFAQ